MERVEGCYEESGKGIIGKGRGRKEGRKERNKYGNGEAWKEEIGRKEEQMKYMQVSRMNCVDATLTSLRDLQGCKGRYGQFHRTRTIQGI